MPTTREERDGRTVTVVASTAVIDAPIESVWDVLVDVDRYPEWNPFTVSVQTTLALGDPVDMQVRLRPPKQMRQVEYVSAFEPGTKVCWGTTIGPGWFLTADRCQTLTDLGDGRTRYVTADAFTGVGVRLMLRLVGHHVQRGFDDVAAALKARCETPTRSAPQDSDRPG